MDREKKHPLRTAGEIAAAIILCQAAGMIGALFTIKAIPTWYAALEKPSFNPPNWIFGPVWLTLYTMMGVSLYLVWREREKPGGSRAALWIFGLQLFLNAIWTPVFFGARLLFPAFIVISLLWFFIILTILSFRKHNRIAAILLIPYLLWVSFASILNLSIWLLNRT